MQVAISVNYIYNEEKKGRFLLKIASLKSNSSEEIFRVFSKCLETYQLKSSLFCITTLNGILIIKVDEIYFQFVQKLDQWSIENNLQFRSAIHWIRCIDLEMDLAIQGNLDNSYRLKF